MPTQKYQNEGGPSAVDIAELLRTYSTNREDDLRTFIMALGLNWLIGGTDAHAKNFSLLLGSRRIRLAPLYDVASILPYDEFDMRKVKLATKIGGKYLLSEIGLHEWQKFAREIRMDADELVGRLRYMAEQIPDQASAARARAQKEGLDNPVVERLAEQLIERAKQCRRLLCGA
jgi:serine/threonine-protein kinase HipA